MAAHPGRINAFTGTEAASFLEIPVGGRPAAMGNAYSAEASDAYAPIYNPAGLGFLDSTQLAGMHLSYLENVNYEFASFVHPFSYGHSFGFAAQYFNPGDTAGTDVNGNPTGNFGGHYAAYSLAYSHHLGEAVSLGITAKYLDARIADVSANAYGFDFGSMFRMTDRLTLAAVVSNIGTKMKFLDEADTLPQSYRIGASYSVLRELKTDIEGIYDGSGLYSAAFGMEWSPINMASLRAGYNTATIRQTTALAGFSTGIGLHLFGQEFDYAWVPLGDLGDTQYFSLVMRFGHAEPPRRNLIHYRHQKTIEEAEDLMLDDTSTLPNPQVPVSVMAVQKGMPAGDNSPHLIIKSSDDPYPH